MRDLAITAAGFLLVLVVGYILARSGDDYPDP